MPRCLSCHSEVPDTNRFCSNCGTPVPAGELATAISAELQPLPPVAVGIPISSPLPKKTSLGSLGSLKGPTQGRFVPGTILAERYRVIGLLGAGGMGEVYRADDLTLGQPIALKFLPPAASQDADLLERFRNEVRIARKVSHPNVCRVYDVGEANGLTFLTMEYVDGEDLSSLLRRIGRLPEDKALETARQICAGLAAAHAKGVLHRDLKPANVMLDGRGQAIIMDFGLAAIAEQVQGAEIRSGTPAYMSPEQLSGKEVTTKSDIYSLGVVLHEIFTGKRQNDVASTHAGVPASGQASKTYGSQTYGSQTHGSHPGVPGVLLDPLTDRVLRRCMDADPEKRPPNVLAVAAALPGGDPLAAALAAGETPSPEMVAAAGEVEGLSPKVALITLAAALLCFGIVVWLGIAGSANDRLPLDERPEVLVHQAQEIVEKLGYSSHSADSAWDYTFDNALYTYAVKNDKPKVNWDRLYHDRPPYAMFFYRQGDEDLVPLWLRGSVLTPGIITEDDPPLIVPGQRYTQVDMAGRLVRFYAIPPEKDESPVPNRSVDWAPAFIAAGLDVSQLTPAEPQWSALCVTDTRAAWTGIWPGSGRPLRVEAAALHGKIVFFSTVGPWTPPFRSEAGQKGEVARWIWFLFGLGLYAFGIWMAGRNHRLRRTDFPSAAAISAFIFFVVLAIWLCSAHFGVGYGIAQMFQRALATALLTSATVMLLYLSVEPAVRRFWPQAIISWTRLLSGKVRDALVAQDALSGVVLGLTWSLVGRASDYVAIHRFGAGYNTGNLTALTEVRHAFGEALGLIPSAITTTFVFFGVLLILRLIFRRLWLAGLVFTAIFTVLNTLGTDHLWLTLPTAALIYGIAALALTRFGLITLMVAVVVANLLMGMPMSGDPSRWYFSTVLVPQALLIAFTLWAFRTSLGGRRLLPDDPD